MGDPAVTHEGYVVGVDAASGADVSCVQFWYLEPTPAEERYREFMAMCRQAMPDIYRVFRIDPADMQPRAGSAELVAEGYGRSPTEAHVGASRALVVRSVSCNGTNE
jgi:hypothetical protein